MSQLGFKYRIVGLLLLKEFVNNLTMHRMSNTNIHIFDTYWRFNDRARLFSLVLDVILTTTVTVNLDLLHLGKNGC
jgi:hypothetical protein